MLKAVWIVSVLIAAVAPARAATLDEIQALVSEATDKLPDHFEDRGPASAAEMAKPLPGDIYAYARWYWIIDNIEGACSHLGQRSNIEMVSSDVTTRLVYPTMYEDHPDHTEYLAIYELIDGAVTDLGEGVLCPAMYKLLGPDGSLMPLAVKVNGLLDPDDADKYRITVEDGVLWSDRDYCDRRYYLEPPADDQMHSLACEQAKSQGF